jgi:flagellar hook-length control protein FliK
MTQTNIDYLFQMTAPGATRLPGSGTRNSDSSSLFGEHFSQSSPALSSPVSKTSGSDLSRQSSPVEQDSATPLDAPPPAPQTAGNSNTQRDVQERAAGSDGESDRPQQTAAAESDADVDSTEQPVAEEDATEESAEHADGAELGAAADLRAAAVHTLITSDEALSDSAEQSAEVVTVAGNDGAVDGAAHESQSKARVKLAAGKIHVEQVAEQVVKDAQLPGQDEAQQATLREKKARATGKNDAATDGSRVEAERARRQLASVRDDEQLPAVERARELAAEAEVESADTSSSDGARADSDEARRREPSGSMSRSDSTAKLQNALIAAVNQKAGPPSGETSTGAQAGDDAIRPAGNAAAPKGEPLANILGRSHSGAGATSRARQAAGDEGAPRVDPSRFIGRVAKAFQMAQERDGKLHLRLSPPELGSLRLELSVKEGVMTATLEAETTAARKVLLDHLPALRDRLAEQNIRIERFDVDVRRDDGGGQADGRAAQHQQHNHQPDQSPPRRQPATEPRFGEAGPTDNVIVENRIGNTQINLVA